MTDHKIGAREEWLAAGLQLGVFFATELCFDMRGQNLDNDGWKVRRVATAVSRFARHQQVCV